ncbi:hypothetical protein MRB53_042120 [Persea americana]|nr:hypothetical protein MRB53_042120 [Persea americana]
MVSTGPSSCFMAVMQISGPSNAISRRRDVLRTRRVVVDERQPAASGRVIFKIAAEYHLSSKARSNLLALGGQDAVGNIKQRVAAPQQSRKRRTLHTASLQLHSDDLHIPEGLEKRYELWKLDVKTFFVHNDRPIQPEDRLDVARVTSLYLDTLQIDLRRAWDSIYWRFLMLFYYDLLGHRRLSKRRMDEVLSAIQRDCPDHEANTIRKRLAEWHSFGHRIDAFAGAFGPGALFILPAYMDYLFPIVDRSKGRKIIDRFNELDVQAKVAAIGGNQVAKRVRQYMLSNNGLQWTTFTSCGSMDTSTSEHAPNMANVRTLNFATEYGQSRSSDQYRSSDAAPRAIPTGDLHTVAALQFRTSPNPVMFRTARASETGREAVRVALSASAGGLHEEALETNRKDGQRHEVLQVAGYDEAQSACARFALAMDNLWGSSIDSPTDRTDHFASDMVDRWT